MPWTGSALKVGDHGVLSEGGMRAEEFGRSEDGFGGDGIPLLRHGGGGAAVGDEGLLDFRELIGAHDHHVKSDLAEGPSDELSIS
jgi:hypothetical protein